MNTAKQPEKLDFTLFLDRTHGGKRLLSILQRVGLKIESHHRTFVHNTDDDVWIKAVGRQNWIIVTGDKGIEAVPRNRQAVIDARCKVFILSDTNSLPEIWAAAIIIGRIRIAQIIRKNDGPFFVTIGKETFGHVSPVRFAAGGGPRAEMTVEPPVDMATPVAASVSLPQPALPQPEPAQKNLKFPSH